MLVSRSQTLYQTATLKKGLVDTRKQLRSGMEIYEYKHQTSKKNLRDYATVGNCPL